MNLAGNGLGAQGAWEIGRAFASGWGKALRVLSLASNGLGAGGVEALLEAARGGTGREGGRERDRPFRYYHVREEGMNVGGGRRDHLRPDFASSSYLASTSSSSAFPPPLLVTVPSETSSYPLQSLQILNLFLNGAGDEGASEVAAALAHGLLPSLQFLDLAANRITQEGVGGLVSALQEDRDGIEGEGGVYLRVRRRRKRPDLNLAFNLLPWEKESYVHAMPPGVSL